MSKRPSRGVSSGIGSPTKMTGRDGDLTIRKTKEGKILYVKEHGSWHPINTGVDTAKLKKDVDRLIRSVNTLRSDNNPFPTINALNIRKNVATATVDPKITFTVAGTDEFVLGLDTNDSNKFKIDTGSAIGGATKVTLDSSGNLDAAGNMNIASSKVYKVNGTEILSATALASAVKINNDNWSGTALEDGNIASSSDWDAAHTHITANGSSHSLLTATAGTLTASKAIVVDASSRVDEVKSTLITVGSGSATGVITSDGDHSITIRTGNTDSGAISIVDGANGAINLAVHGTGVVRTGSGSNPGHITTKNAYDLKFSTNDDTDSGDITIATGLAGDITINPQRNTVTAAPIGFTHYASPTPSDDNPLEIDFIGNGNKSRMTFTGADVTVTEAKLILPTNISGNYTVLIKTHSSRTNNSITAWTSHYGASGTDSTGVIWPAGSKPDVTDSNSIMDIFSFYWDCNEKKCYGVATQNFQV
jgi:hypothetical protein